MADNMKKMFFCWHSFCFLNKVKEIADNIRIITVRDLIKNGIEVDKTMGKIKDNYEEVYNKAENLRHYISFDLSTRIENEYGQIQSMIDKVDEATAAKLQEAMDESQQKAVLAAMVLDKVLSCIVNSSKQADENEHRNIP